MHAMDVLQVEADVRKAPESQEWRHSSLLPSNGDLATARVFLTLSSWVWVEWRPSYYPTLPSWVWVESRSDCRRRRGTGNGEGDEKTKQKINHWVTELCLCFYRTCHQLHIYLLNSAHWLLNIFLRNWWEVVRYANGCGCPTPSITLHYFKVLHDCLEEMVSFLSPYILP